MRIRCWFVVALLVHAAGTPAADNYPSRPVRALLPQGPGSTTILSNMAVCVHGKVPAKSVQDVVKLERDKPGQLNMASAGIGSTSHLAGVLFSTLAGISTKAE